MLWDIPVILFLGKVLGFAMRHGIGYNEENTKCRVCRNCFFSLDAHALIKNFKSSFVDGAFSTKETEIQTNEGKQ